MKNITHNPFFLYESRCTSHSRLLCLFYIITASFLISCEFDSDKEFFREIEKPGEIMIGLDLAGVRPNDPIYIYDDTKLYFNLNNAGKKLFNQEVMINGQLLYSTGGDYITIIKDNLIKGANNSLKMTFRIKTDSGSLADLLNAEFYEGVFEFILIPVDNAFDLGVSDGITNEGYLELKWDKPSFEQLDIESYEIKFKDFRGENIIETLDGSATSFVDKDYIGGYRSYSISMKFVEGKIKDKVVYYNMSYSGITSDDIKIEFNDLESTTIEWLPNKYRCKYFILHDRNDLAVASVSFDSPVARLQAPVFPEESGFYTVIVAPDDMDVSEISYSSGGIEKFYEYKAPASKLAMAVDSYSIEDMLIYGREGITLKVGDARTLETIKVYESPYFENMTSVSVSPNSDKLLLFIGYDWGFKRDNKVYLYINKNDLSGVPIEIDTPKANGRYKRINLISDNLIFIESSLDGDGVNTNLILVSAKSGEVIESIATNIYNNIDLSYDGNRLAVTDRAGFEVNIYDITDQGFKLFKSIPMDPFYNPEDLLFCKINPQNRDQIVFWSTTARKILVLNTATERSEFIDGSFEGIDPFTGRIFSFDADWNNNKLMNVYNDADINMAAFSFRAHTYGLNAINDFVMMYQRSANISKYFK